MTTTTMTCTCDYDCIGDPLTYVKVGRCAMHDECDGCGKLDLTTKWRRYPDGDKEWFCDTCNQEVA